MTTLIFGIGPGLFVVLSLWASAGLICLASLRTDRRVGICALVVVGIVTIILVSIPRASETPSIHKDKPYDHLFIWRVILVALLAASSIIGFLVYVNFELAEPVQPVRITTWVY